jgi:cobalamin biosynthesis Mg chelatase CobN
MQKLTTAGGGKNSGSVRRPVQPVNEPFAFCSTKPLWVRSLLPFEKNVMAATAKKTAARKSTAKRGTTKKTAAKKSPAKRSTTKRSTAKKTAAKKGSSKSGTTKKNKLGVKNSLVNNINAHKKKGDAKSPKRSTVSKEAYEKMEQNWEKKK